nr:lipocalin family protein [Aliiroseovarius subalbicans]
MGGAGDSLFYRDTKVAIASSTRYEADRFSGMWQIRGEFAEDKADVIRGAVEFRPGRDGRIAQIAIFGPRRGGWGVLDEYDVDQPMPARFVAGEPPYATEYWVLWVDDDYRTAVVGTPSGSFGWILDRNRTGGEDRITAARRVLQFNGYDLSRLVTQ